MNVSEADFPALRDRMAANLRGAKLAASMPDWAMPARRSKFGNVKKVVDGVTFDSSAEARRYIELKAMQAAGQIANLELQPRYVLLDKFTDGTGKKHRAVEYRGDFKYLDGGGHTCVEDVKGHPTEAFKIKWKMVIQKYPLVRFEISR